MTTTLVLPALLGDYPNTSLLRNGQIRPTNFELVFEEEKSMIKAFPKAVREQAFDVSELAIVTYLTAKANQLPFVLLPVVVRGKFHHDALFCSTERPLGPSDLAGRRVGIRSRTVTTVTWIRGILQNDYGVDLDKVKWVTFEDAHVAEVRDPIGFERAPAGKKLMGMLLDGQLDAAVLIGKDREDPRVQSVIPNPKAAAQAWYQRYGLVPVNHMVMVKSSLSRANAGVVREVFHLLAESKERSGIPAGSGPDPFPLGVEPIRKSLQMISQYAFQQGLIPRQFSVDELFDDVTRELGK